MFRVILIFKGSVTLTKHFSLAWLNLTEVNLKQGWQIQTDHLSVKPIEDTFIIKYLPKDDAVLTDVNPFNLNGQLFATHY